MIDGSPAPPVDAGREAFLRRRGRLAWTLTAVTTALVTVFLAGLTLTPELYGRRLGSGPFTFGMLLPLLLMAVCAVFTMFYLHTCARERRPPGEPGA